MLLARAIGHATSTVKHASLRGAKLLLVQPLRSLTVEPVLTLDRLGAAPGDLVVTSSDGLFARETLHDNTSPARWSVVGVLDNVDDPHAALAAGPQRQEGTRA